jgi:hypothetical protein
VLTTLDLGEFRELPPLSSVWPYLHTHSVIWRRLGASHRADPLSVAVPAAIAQKVPMCDFTAGTT